MATDEIIITTQIKRNTNVEFLKSIPDNLIGMANIPAPIDVPAINSILPNILFNICFWLEAELNRRHKDFQSFALPTELSSLLVFLAMSGIEPPTSAL